MGGRAAAERRRVPVAPRQREPRAGGAVELDAADAAAAGRAADHGRGEPDGEPHDEHGRDGGWRDGRYGHEQHGRQPRQHELRDGHAGAGTGTGTGGTAGRGDAQADAERESEPRDDAVVHTAEPGGRAGYGPSEWVVGRYGVRGGGVVRGAFCVLFIVPRLYHIDLCTSCRIHLFDAEAPQSQSVRK